jgi:CRISPR-associated protein Cas2
MFVILVYDMRSARTQKIHKECSKYLLWKQNSVFEGEITEAQLRELRNWINGFVTNEETVIIYEFRSESAFTKHTYGEEETANDFL